MDICVEDQHHHQLTTIESQQFDYGNGENIQDDDANTMAPRMCFTYPLLENVHLDLNPPTPNGRSFITRGKFKYFHYTCDGYSDVGWGCAYRTLQMVCSWIEDKLMNGRDSVVSSILEIQQTLIDVGDKPPEFFGSRDPIDDFDVFYVIDTLYNVRCNILHAPQREDLKKYANILKKHFEDGGGLVMMGGDVDASSKGIAGLHISANQAYFLVIDPHYVGRPKSAEELIKRGYVRWLHSSEFVDSSFYYFCLPEI